MRGNMKSFNQCIIFLVSFQMMTEDDPEWNIAFKFIFLIVLGLSLLAVVVSKPPMISYFLLKNTDLLCVWRANEPRFEAIA